MDHSSLQTILYVEDDRHMRSAAKLVLEVLGRFRVCAFASGKEALNQAADCVPDLIVLDVMLPDIDGVTTLKMLRRFPHLADTPALFVTGASTSEEIAQYMALGAIGIIPKPLVPLRLTDQVHSLWEQRQALA